MRYKPKQKNIEKLKVFLNEKVLLKIKKQKDGKRNI